MKSFLSMSTILLVCVIMMANGDKKGRDNEDSVEAEVSKSPKRVPEGRCSCRDMENQIETLEFRLDRMVDLWNDFVDKNRNPYDRPSGVRRPPQGGIGGGRGPYLPGDERMPPPYNRRPGYGARNAMEDEQESSSPRKFRF